MWEKIEDFFFFLCQKISDLSQRIICYTSSPLATKKKKCTASALFTPKLLAFIQLAGRLEIFFFCR